MTTDSLFPVVSLKVSVKLHSQNGQLAASIKVYWCTRFSS